MLAEPDGHDSKMEDACSQKVSCGDTLTSHFFQTEQSPFLMFFSSIFKGFGEQPSVL